MADVAKGKIVALRLDADHVPLAKSVEAMGKVVGSILWRLTREAFVRVEAAMSDQPGRMVVLLRKSFSDPRPCRLPWGPKWHHQ